MGNNETAKPERKTNARLYQVYRYFAADGTLLYIGSSFNAVKRAFEHKRHSHWYPKAVRIEMQTFPSRAAMRTAETQAIKSERPKHNVVHLKPTTTRAQQSRASSLRRGTGVVAYWRSLEGSSVYERVLAHWRDPNLTALDAIAKAPEEAGKLIAASRNTWERIFGPRGVNFGRGGRGPSPVDRLVSSFREPSRASDFSRVCEVWTSPGFGPKEALRAIGEEFPELRGASRLTLNKVTGLGRSGVPVKA